LNELPPSALRVLERGRFCHVAALTPTGPHVTPMVFAVAGGRIWVTTSRRSVKARAWRSDARVAGLVRDGDDAVAFTGTARTHDALDPSSWGRSIAGSPLLSLAAARFTRKNARFFAGYAVDAHRIPLAWTPPGRVFVEIVPERGATFDGRRPAAAWGAWGGADEPVPSAERFRASRTGPGPLDGLPDDVRGGLGDRGRAALALEGRDGPVVLPAWWAISGAGLYAIASEDAVALAAPETPRQGAALGVDRASSWRARRMVGAMARGVAEIHVPGRLSAGERSARAIAAAVTAAGEDVAVLRLRPDRLVWWRGWDSGTVAA
jgi:hypothetical protein